MLFSNMNKAMAEKNTKSFILRVDSETMNAIEAWAADEFRSTNGQLQWIITEALRKAKRLPKKKQQSQEDTNI
jgi:hypothetical protein